MTKDLALTALEATCSAAIKRDGGKVLDDLSSAAFVDLLRIGSALGQLPPAKSYSITPLDVQGEDHRFIVTVNTSERDVETIATMRLVKDVWRIAAIKIPGVRD